MIVRVSCFRRSAQITPVVEASEELEVANSRGTREKSPHVSESKTVLDSGSTPWILESLSVDWIPDSGFQSLAGFRIADSSIKNSPRIL